MAVRSVRSRFCGRWSCGTLRGSYTPAALSTSAVMGTVEFTGLEMMAMIACEQRATTYETTSSDYANHHSQDRVYSQSHRQQTLPTVRLLYPGNLL